MIPAANIMTVDHERTAAQALPRPLCHDFLGGVLRVLGLQQVLIKVASADIPPLWQASRRMLGATALLLLGEPLTWQLMLALGGVAAGIVLVSRRR